MIAICTIRLEPHYRREAFVSGLQKAGYRVVERGTPKSKEDLLITWNRYGTTELRADSWESDGGTVLVAENGYIGKDEIGRQLYALSVHGHNGSGWFPVGEEDRFTPLGIEVYPWVDRPEGYALICGQRGIGSRQMASPSNWHYQIQKYLGQFGPTKVRLHPGNKPATTRLDDDLAGANKCVIWSSSSGVLALTLGVPVMYDAPRWICQQAAVSSRSDGLIIDDDLRRKALHKMSWGQWRVSELESGEPFIRIRDNIGAAKW